MPRRPGARQYRRAAGFPGAPNPGTARRLADPEVTMRTALGALAALAAAAALAPAVPAAAWPSGEIGRLAVAADLERLNADLLASRSATATLEAWCADHRLAEPARIAAVADRGARAPATDEIRRLLRVGPDSEVRYRKVRLMCGSLTLSEAENWYAPERLTPEMNRLLDQTDTPFGKAVLGLDPSRRTLDMMRLWSPLPANFDLGPLGAEPASDGARLEPPLALFRHRALVLRADGAPIALVVETYERDLLAFRR